MSIAKKLERLLQTKNEIKAAIESKGVIVAQNEPFRNYPAKIAAIQGGGAIPLAEYDMSALQDNSVIGYVEAVPEGYVRVRIEGTGAMRDGRGIGWRSPFSGNNLIVEATIGDGITKIGNMAFTICTSLTSVIIPNSVTTIGNNAFADCTSLTSVIIPDSVTTIGIDAFGNCTSLQEIVIPNSVTTIGSNAFAGCTSLTSVIIPDSVTTIGEYAFTDCNPDLILKPEALEKPEGWSDLWNAYDWGSSFYTVWWGGIPPQQ